MRKHHIAKLYKKFHWYPWQLGIDCRISQVRLIGGTFITDKTLLATLQAKQAKNAKQSISHGTAPIVIKLELDTVKWNEITAYVNCQVYMNADIKYRRIVSKKGQAHVNVSAWELRNK